MKARPLIRRPDGSKDYCEPAEATHLWIMLPGPFRNRILPVQIKGTREGTGNWSWNGDTEKPTLKPSVLTWNDTDRCHTWITDGQAIFLDDCSHKYAGQTLDLLDVDKLPELDSDDLEADYQAQLAEDIREHQAEVFKGVTQPKIQP